MALTNYNMYEMTLNVLRKDKKGSITIEEFESLLKRRSLWLFRQLLPKDGVTKVYDQALSPFKIMNDDATDSAGAGDDFYKAAFSALSGANSDNKIGHVIAARVGSTGIDLVTTGELRERVGDAITQPTTDDPCAVIASDSLHVYPSTVSGTVYIDYYKYPTQPYLDYYIDSSNNYQYLTEGQSAHTLGTSEVARDGSTTGSSVTSNTTETEWYEPEKIYLVELILNDLGVIVHDQAVLQQAMNERQVALTK